MSSASRGLAPREGLESLFMKMGRTGPLAEPRRGPQASKSGDPHSQNADRKTRGYKVSLSTTLACQQSSYTGSSVVSIDEPTQYSVQHLPCIGKS